MIILMKGDAWCEGDELEIMSRPEFEAWILTQGPDTMGSYIEVIDGKAKIVCG